jgi:hypothetical protein
MPPIWTGIHTIRRQTQCGGDAGVLSKWIALVPILPCKSGRRWLLCSLVEHGLSWGRGGAPPVVAPDVLERMPKVVFEQADSAIPPLGSDH